MGFFLVYVLELGIRLTGSGFKCFIKGSLFNNLDIAIIVFGLIDIVVCINLLWDDSQMLINGTAITALRIFRHMRTFKLARYWSRFESILDTMGKTVTHMGAFSIFLFLFTYIYTILGLEFF